MTPEQFLSVAQVLPEAMWLLSTPGEIVAANAAAGHLVGRVPQTFLGTRLSALVTDTPAQVADYLGACSRTRALALGALTFRHANGTVVACRSEGTLLQRRTADAPARLLLRCKPKPVAAQPFVALNDKIQELIRSNTQLRRAQALLRHERERFEVTLTSIGDAVIATDTEGRVTFMNPRAEALTGWSAQEARGKDLTEVYHLVNMETRQLIENPVTKVIREDTMVGLANHRVLRARDGTDRPIDDSGSPIRGAEGRLVGVVLVFRDVTERRRVEEELRRAASLLDLTHESILVLDLNETILFWNRGATEIYGWPAEEALGQVAYRLLQTRFPKPLEAIKAELLQHGRWKGDLTQTRRDGSAFVVSSRWALQRDAQGRPLAFLEINSDVTARTHMEAQLRHSLAEKEVLLKEVHHRVKNNLQIISSLLSLQSATGQHATVHDFVQESERRIQAMALVHETLYQGSDVTQLPLAKYVRTLSTHLVRAYGGDTERIAIHTQLDAVVLPLDTAVPCGLILSELLSNCLKHAFPNGQAGEVTVTLTQEADRVFLTVRDNGCGFPEHLDLQTTESLGLQLVGALTEQLQGTIAVSRTAGSAFTVTFPLPNSRQCVEEFAGGESHM